MKMSHTHKTVHSKEEESRTSALTKTPNGFIAKKPGKSLSFSNPKEDSPVRLSIPNGIANKSPGKSLVFMSNKQPKDETKKPSNSIGFSNMEESKIVETPVKSPAIKKPIKSLKFSMEEPKVIESHKTPGNIDISESKLAQTTKKSSKSLGFYDKTVILTSTPSKNCYNMDKSEVESLATNLLSPATKNSVNGPSLSNIERPAATKKSNKSFTSHMEELKIESPATKIESLAPTKTETLGLSNTEGSRLETATLTAAVEESLSMSVKKKAGRPPGAKNKGLSFSNIKKHRIRRPADARASKPKIGRPPGSKNVRKSLGLSTVDESEVESPAIIISDITTANVKEAEPAPKPKQTRTRNSAQKLTQFAQLRGKTTGNDSCDATESKPGRRRRAYLF